jgi:cell division protein FtsW
MTGLVVLWLGARSSGKIGAILLAALPVLLLLVLAEPYRLDRLVSFLHPERDPQGGSFQLNQSMEAFRRGGWTGVGLGRSEAPRGYVFSSYSDFVLSTLGEELGFLGVAVVLASYLWLARIALRVSAHCPDPAGSHLALSCVSLILMQAAVNVFVVAGLLPTKGLALPLVSYGGSSLIATLLLVGLIRSVARCGAVGL